MRLIVIRHGQTVGDIEDRYGGAYDDALSVEGLNQVKTLCAELADKGIKAIYTSPLQRAQQTAQGLVSATGAPVTIIHDLRERAQYGPLTGLTKTEAKTQFPDFVEQVKDRLNTLPNAESYAAASARTQTAYAEVLTQAPATAAIVWHGGGMRVLFRDILQFGELKEIGDCCWVELEILPVGIKILNHKRIIFDF